MIPLWADLVAVGLGGVQGALFASGFVGQRRLDLLGVTIIGIVMGMGYALWEENVLSKGVFRNTGLSTYILPSAWDVPEVETIPVEALVTEQAIPREWLEKLAEKLLTDAEKAEIQGSGSFDELMRKLRERLAEQQDRHQGGNKWIGTGGSSPFGNNGTHPEGIRVGGDSAGNRTAVKVWDKREFRNLDDSVELGTRNIKVALRRLRRFARQGAAEELDLDFSPLIAGLTKRELERRVEQEFPNATTRKVYYP